MITIVALEYWAQIRLIQYHPAVVIVTSWCKHFAPDRLAVFLLHPQVPLEHNAPSSTENEVGARPLAPPTVSTHLKVESDSGGDCVEDAVARLVQEVEVKHDGNFVFLGRSGRTCLQCSCRR